MNRILAFDVDSTLDVADGPCPVEALRALRRGRDILVICGNWKRFVPRVPDWWEFISTMGPESVDKDYVHNKTKMLRDLKVYIPGKNGYIMIGNKYEGNPHIADDLAARQAGWTFLNAEEWQALFPLAYSTSQPRR